jgi:excisionase family DNA binding protein
MSDNPLMTVKAVAEELKLSERYITQQITEGKLPAVKFGKTYRIYRHDLDEFIKNRRTQKDRE